MLEVDALATAYGQSQVLFGVSFGVRAGEAVTLLGRNGMGKTTTVRSLMGMVRPRGGTIVFEGKPLHGLPSYRVAQAGLGLVPEGRQVSPNLTVRENLVATAARRSSRAEPWTLSRVFALFPQLAERRAHFGSQLSGGEQQMLAIGRALMTNPRMLILDEATEGLAPLVRIEIYRALEDLKASGLAILIIGKALRSATRVGGRHHVLERGRVVWSGVSVEQGAERELEDRTL